MPREWRGIEVDERLADSWAERLYSIPGIAVYSSSLFPSFTFYPWPHRSERQSIARELESAFGDIAVVHSADRGLFPMFSLSPTEEYMPGGWWEQVIERLEQFASRRPIPTPTIEDFEREILLGASEVFAFKQKVWPHERYDRNPRTIATPASEEEARQFLEALADLNQTSVYDLYLDDLQRFGGLDVPLSRWQFGHDSALRGLGLWHKGGRIPSVDYQVPVWWSVASGSFDVCVLTQPMGPRHQLYSILIGHPESGISTKFTLDPIPNQLREFVDFRGCSKESYFREELDAFGKYVHAPGGGNLVCEGMPGDQIPDYIANLFPRWERERVVAAVERVLAGCFAKDR